MINELTLSLNSLFIINSFSLIFKEVNSFKGYFKKVPRFTLYFLLYALWIPITLFEFKFNIGEPDDPDKVLHLCFISSSPSFNFSKP